MRQALKSLEVESIINRMRNELTFIFILIGSIFFLIFLPISYLDSHLLKKVWNSLIYINWMMCVFLGLLTFVKSRQNEYQIFSLVNFLLFSFFLGLYSNLIFFGLLPVYYFIPKLLMFSVFFIYLLDTLFLGLFTKYKSYLIVSLHFCEEGASFLIILIFFRALSIVRNVLNTISSDGLLENPQEILFNVMKVFLLSVLLVRIRRFLMDVENKDQKSFKFEIWFLIISVVVVEIYNLYLYQQLDFFWVSIFTLSVLIIYASQTPTRKINSLVLQIAFLFVILFLLGDILDISVNIKEHGFYISTFFNVLNISVGLIGGWGVVKQYLNQKKERTIYKKSDVESAAQELLQKDGFTSSTISKIITICSITNQRGVLRNLIDNDNVSRELKNYLEMNLYCLEFESKKRKNIMIEKHVHQEFEENLKKKLPIKITNIEMWQLYANNEILDRYLKNEITRLKPHSFFYKIKKGGSIAMLTMLLISFASQEMPSSSSVSFLKVLQKIYHWNDLRTTELKLKFTEAFSPFWDNEDFKRHYSTYMIYEWIPKWENYVGTHEKDKILLSKAQIGKIIDWYRLALDFYKKKDEISGFANMKLGILYYINENYKTALTHLEIANKSEIHDLDKDDTLTYIAKTLEKDNQNEKAFNILMDIKDKKGYYSSKMYLSGYLFQQKKHSETIYVLKQVPENKLTELELYYLGESYFNEKEFNQSERICKKLFELSEKDNDTSSKLLSLSMLAEIYYQARDFFNSTVEYYLYFKELFLKKMYVTDKMRNDEQLKLNHFKTSIDEVCKMNDKDFRVNLWYFVYYNRSGKAELAVEYLKKHLEYGAREYEKDFTLWILQDIYNKK